MPVFFWEFDDYNDIEREWICFCLNLLVFIFTGMAFIRSLNFHRKITFQIVPLSFNLVSIVILLILKLFQKGYQFDLIGYLIQTFTYFLFGYTFVIILLKLNKNKNSLSDSTDKINKQKIYFILFIMITVVHVILIILVSVKVIQKKCDQHLFIVSCITLGCQVFSYIPTIANGRQFLTALKVKKKSTLTQTMLSSEIQSNNNFSDQFTVQRRKQIIVALGIYTITLVIRVFFLIVSIFMDESDLIKCEQCESVYIFTSDHLFGQFILILIQINQLLPHIIIPVVLFIVPMNAKRKKHSFLIESQPSTYQDEQLDYETRSQIIKSKVSSVFSDKIDSPKRSR